MLSFFNPTSRRQPRSGFVNFVFFIFLLWCAHCLAISPISSPQLGLNGRLVEVPDVLLTFSSEEGAKGRLSLILTYSI